MNRFLRSIAAVLMVLLLPAQGFAAACAQICAQSREAQRGAMLAAMSSMGVDEVAQTHEGCGDSELGAGKCCKAHAFMIDQPATPQAKFIPSFEREPFVARWTNFIPEEPSPPPIGGATIA